MQPIYSIPSAVMNCLRFDFKSQTCQSLSRVKSVDYPFWKVHRSDQRGVAKKGLGRSQRID